MFRLALKSFAIVIGSVFVVVALALIYLFTAYPVKPLVNGYPVKTQSGAMTISNTTPAGWVPLSQISDVAIGAVVVSEDWAFFEHKGLDFKQIRLAFKENMRAKAYRRGASTISQQVARNVFLSQDKTIKRKIVEAFITFRLERRLTKEKILEIYLNIAEWGNNVYGIAEASRLYFSKSPAWLSPKEGAFLAMLLPSPKRYSESFRERRLTDFAEKTVNQILEKMAIAGYIEPFDAEIAKLQPLHFELADDFNYMLW